MRFASAGVVGFAVLFAGCGVDAVDLPVRVDPCAVDPVPGVGLCLCHAISFRFGVTPLHHATPAPSPALVGAGGNDLSKFWREDRTFLAGRYLPTVFCAARIC